MIKSLRKQLGFLYLTTGGNGTGKTLFTLHDVRKLQQETGRPVFFYGFDALPPLLEFGWKPFEPENWQDLPDGSICVIDECQNVMPVRGTGKPPAWISAIAEVHRKRGFDFFLITQHPLNFDSFVRRLIASPGWHRHFKASAMGDSSNELKWSSVKDNPQIANSSAATGEVVSRAFPKEVYTWYQSASIHTARKRVPLKVWGAIAGLFAAVAMVVFVVLRLLSNVDTPAPEAAQAQGSPLVVAPPSAPSYAAPTSGREGITTAEYLQLRVPRIPGFPNTAPVYDGVTQPVDAPYPAACVQMGPRCECFSQQATRLIVDADVCARIVARGYFVDWKQPERPQLQQQRPAPRAEGQPAPAQQQPVIINLPQAREKAPSDSQWSQSLALRNAQVRGSFDR